MAPPGIEPRAAGLSRQCSATELQHPLTATPLSFPLCGLCLPWISLFCAALGIKNPSLSGLCLPWVSLFSSWLREPIFEWQFQCIMWCSQHWEPIFKWVDSTPSFIVLYACAILSVSRTHAFYVGCAHVYPDVIVTYVLVLRTHASKSRVLHCIVYVCILYNGHKKAVIYRYVENSLVSHVLKLSSALFYIHFLSGISNNCRE